MGGWTSSPTHTLISEVLCRVFESQNASPTHTLADPPTHSHQQIEQLKTLDAFEKGDVAVFKVHNKVCTMPSATLATTICTADVWCFTCLSHSMPSDFVQFICAAHNGAHRRARRALQRRAHPQSLTDPCVKDDVPTAVCIALALAPWPHASSTSREFVCCYFVSHHPCLALPPQTYHSVPAPTIHQPSSCFAIEKDLKYLYNRCHCTHVCAHCTYWPRPDRVPALHTTLN
jgi:hypothetical protein